MATATTATTNAATENGSSANFSLLHCLNSTNNAICGVTTANSNHPLIKINIHDLNSEEPSFSWSDIPSIVSNDPYQQRNHPALPTTTTTNLQPKAETTESATITSSLPSTRSNSIDWTANTNTANNTTAYNTTTKNETTTKDDKTNTTQIIKKNRTVTFSSIIHVRVYEMIVSDHPYNFLPIGLGWKYNIHQSTLQDEQQQQQHDEDGFILIQNNRKQQGNKKTNGKVRRYNYQERIQLLKKVTGLTEAELLLMNHHHSLEQPQEFFPTKGTTRKTSLPKTATTKTLTPVQTKTKPCQSSKEDVRPTLSSALPSMSSSSSPSSATILNCSNALWTVA